MKKLHLIPLFIVLLFGATSGIAEVNRPQSTSQQAPTAEELQNETPPDAFPQWEEQSSEREKTEDAKFRDLWTKTLLLLACVIAFFVVSIWVLKKLQAAKFTGFGNKGRIQLTERKALSQKSSIWIIQIDNQEVILAESPNGIQIIRENVKPAPEKKEFRMESAERR